MIWDVFCYIFGSISIIGPICLIFWYVKGAREQIRRLNDGKK